MKISDYKGEDAIDILADILEPASKIIGDREVSNLVAKDANKISIVKYILKEHKRSIIEILAAIDRKSYEEYAESMNLLTLPVKVIELINDKELADFFQQQSQMINNENSGFATENTEAKV